MPSSVMFWHSTCFREAISHICEAVFLPFLPCVPYFNLELHHIMLLYYIFSQSFLPAFSPISLHLFSSPLMLQAALLRVDI